MIHGFTGTPGELEPLGEYLHAKGFTVAAPRLKGHGETPEKLAGVQANEWLASARGGLEQLSGCANRVILGLSMGGLIAGLLTLEEEVDGLVLMGAPVFLTNRKAYLAPLIKYVKPYVQKHDPSDYPIPITTYDQIPVTSLAELLKLRHRFLVSLDKITVPTLIVQGMQDGTVRPESGRYLYDKITVEKKQLLELEKSRHVITLDTERIKLFHRIGDFLEEEILREPQD